MNNFKAANQVLATFQSIVNTGKVLSFNQDEPLKVGVDLGTSSIVLVILDQADKPIYGSFEYANAIRDGIIVNYMETVEILKRLKTDAEEALGIKLTKACGAVPPGTIGKNKSIVNNVIESVDMEVGEIMDEPTAAANLLKLSTGYVVDVGGGTTGVSVLRDGKVVSVIDEATGGTHMSLVLAGHYNTTSLEAEKIKREKSKEKQNFQIIQPVVEKMAEITRRAIEASRLDKDSPVYLVGGASNFSDFEKVFEKHLDCKVWKPDYPEFVTPIGIAMGCREEGVKWTK